MPFTTQINILTFRCSNRMNVSPDPPPSTSQMIHEKCHSEIKSCSILAYSHSPPFHTTKLNAVIRCIPRSTVSLPCLLDRIHSSSTRRLSFRTQLLSIGLLHHASRPEPPAGRKPDPRSTRLSAFPLRSQNAVMLLLLLNSASFRQECSHILPAFFLFCAIITGVPLNASDEGNESLKHRALALKGARIIFF